MITLKKKWVKLLRSDSSVACKISLKARDQFWEEQKKHKKKSSRKNNRKITQTKEIIKVKRFVSCIKKSKIKN